MTPPFCCDELAHGLLAFAALGGDLAALPPLAPGLALRLLEGSLPESSLPPPPPPPAATAWSCSTLTPPGSTPPAGASGFGASPLAAAAALGLADAAALASAALGLLEAAALASAASVSELR